MTQFSDQLRQGGAYFQGAQKWNTPGTVPSGLPTPSAPGDTQCLGAAHTQDFSYQVGTASTALASGVFYSASGTATIAAAALTGTGALVTAGVATFDVARGIRITASLDLSTTTFRFVGTDGYGQTLSHDVLGPTGNTLGALGSYRDSVAAFKTVTSITMVNYAASGTSTTALFIGNNNAFGLPYVLTNLGMGQGAYIDGAMATIPPTFAAAFGPTGTAAATSADVRGLCTLATAVLANGTRYITIGMIAPTVNLTPNTDIKVNTFGATPYSG